MSLTHDAWSAIQAIGIGWDWLPVRLNPPRPAQLYCTESKLDRGRAFQEIPQALLLCQRPVRPGSCGIAEAPESHSCPVLLPL